MEHITMHSLLRVIRSRRNGVSHGGAYGIDHDGAA